MYTKTLPKHHLNITIVLHTCRADLAATDQKRRQNHYDGAAYTGRGIPGPLQQLDQTVEGSRARVAILATFVRAVLLGLLARAGAAAEAAGTHPEKER